MGRLTLPTVTARRMSAARKTKSGGSNGGRPQSSGRRCPCAAMTLKRAEARGKSGEHDPSCSFYRLDSSQLR
jgi:hypothetical protein